ncbi:MAG: DNA recombination protein RmuC [Bacteroidetes bacterium]|nr:DNA recombination protein RmuC [Bacteroidota bacterium]
MTFIDTALIVIALLLIVNIIISLQVGKKDNQHELKYLMGALSQQLKDMEQGQKNELAMNRRENTSNAKDLREEVGGQLNEFIKTFSTQLAMLTEAMGERFIHFKTSIDSSSKESRQELKANLDGFKSELSLSLKNFSDNQRANFNELLKNMADQNSTSNSKLDIIRDTVEKKISQLQEGNEKKLDEMRRTVDEKLNETLEKRLGESFKQVSDRLEAVHKGLGEMQSLASSVGDLKKVMSNVKSRGILGEYQLQNLIEDLLTNEQYEKNVKTKLGSGAVVEFAIKMPHGGDTEKTLWLPVDSKFPKEDYEALVEAYERGDIEGMEEYRKAFVKSIRKNAQDIKEKYIDPPNTTEYGIMFLPYESLFGEVLRTPGLFEQLQREFKITVTGPTTLSALLNSLQMGFRTLAIEKRSSEVWDLLGAVKTEFGQFGDVLAKTKRKLIEATNVIDHSETRTRAIERKLRNVQELPQDKTNLLLGSAKNTNSSVADDML